MKVRLHSNLINKISISRHRLIVICRLRHHHYLSSSSLSVVIIIICRHHHCRHRHYFKWSFNHTPSDFEVLNHRILNRVVVMCSGGNIDTPVYIRALERALAIDGRLWLITVTISDRGCALAELTKQINGLGIKLVCTISALCNLWINSSVLYCTMYKKPYTHGQQTLGHQTVCRRSNYTTESIDRIPFGFIDLQSMD